MYSQSNQFVKPNFLSTAPITFPKFPKPPEMRVKRSIIRSIRCSLSRDIKVHPTSYALPIARNKLRFYY